MWCGDRFSNVASDCFAGPSITSNPFCANRSAIQVCERPNSDRLTASHRTNSARRSAFDAPTVWIRHNPLQKRGLDRQPSRMPRDCISRLGHSCNAIPRKHAVNINRPTDKNSNTSSMSMVKKAAATTEVVTAAETGAGSSEVDHVPCEAVDGFLQGLRQRRVRVHVAGQLVDGEIPLLREGELGQ